MNYKEIYNFLSKKEFNKTKNFLTSSTMPWYYNKHQVYQKKDFSQFTHRFYFNDKVETWPEIYDTVSLIINKLKPDKLLRVKANLIINRGKNIAGDFHVDSNEPDLKIAIYYVNTNNGYTLLDPKHKIKINCEENKLLVFDGKILHSAVSQTDEDQRIVFNINYLKKNEPFPKF
jgi:hypothetical protein